MRSPQYWLAELDQYDNPTLIDGSHTNRTGANKAAYFIQSLNLGKPNRRFAVARIELSECVPSAKGVNHSAIKTLNDATESLRKRDAAREQGGGDAT